MGLDMNLKAEKFVSDFMEPEQYNELRNAVNRAIVSTPVPTDGEDTLQSITVSVNVAYWRKANQIHGWFVENVQDGVDNCQDSHVSLDQLRELRDICRDLLDKKTELEHDTGDEVLNHDTLVDYCNKRLPPSQGFFFGAYDIDAWYWEDIRHTFRVLDKIIPWAERERANKSFWEFKYLSSW